MSSKLTYNLSRAQSFCSQLVELHSAIDDHFPNHDDDNFFNDDDDHHHHDNDDHDDDNYDDES